MVVWKGWGFSVLLIPVLCALLMEFSIDSYFGAGFYRSASWPIPLAFLLSSVPVFVFGSRLNNKPARIVVDVETNERLELKTTHSFFWLPMQYWSLVIIGLAVWMYLANIGMIY